MFYQTQTERRPPKGPKIPCLPLVTLTFKLIRARDQTRQRFPEIFRTQKEKPQTDGAKNKTFRSLPSVVKIITHFTY